MSDPVLKLGSSGPAVEELQELLNAKLEPSPNLKVNGLFQMSTKKAVKDFQHEKYLVGDGVVGRCTWMALRGQETFESYDRPPVRLGQADPFTCWKAATSMLLGKMSVGGFQTGSADIEDLNGGTDNGGLGNSQVNMAQFASVNNLLFLHQPQASPQAICGFLKLFGRMMLNVKPVGSKMSTTAKASNGSHLVVLFGARGDMTAEGTTLALYNPEPVGVGELVCGSYAKLTQENPGLFYQILYRKFWASY